MRFLNRWSFALVLTFVGASASQVQSVDHDGVVRGAPKNTPVIIWDARSPDVGSQASMSVVSAPAAAQFATGAGVTVAVLDGGFDLTHEYLDGHLGAQWDALDQDGAAQDLGNGTDDDGDGLTDSDVGHGTFVAGLIAACAPDATILPIRVLDDEGRGNPAALARGIDKAVALGAKVINLSLVSSTTTSQLETSIQAAVNAGITIIAAAGNDPAGPFGSQFLRDRSITVGAVSNSLFVASFSPNQELVDVFAPGVDVVGPLGGATADSYAKWSGTSFSCAFVSAAAVLVKEDHPAMTPAAMKSLLTTATDVVADANPSSRGSADLLEAVTQ